MRLSSIRIKNYRTIENLEIAFPGYYTAICGRNDAGKSNILKILRSAFRSPDRMFYYNQDTLSVKEDFTQWVETPPDKRKIQVEISLRLDNNDDEGFFRFLKDYLTLPEQLLLSNDGIEIKLSVSLTGEEKTEQIGLTIGETIYIDLKAQEVLNRLRSSSAFLFHDSTEFFHPYRFRQAASLFHEVTATESENINAAKAKLDKVLTQIAKRTQQDLSEVLERLKDKYKVGFGVVDFEMTDLPYTITLGNDDGDVELEKWGSGTQNRTRILMTLFKAKKVRTAETSAAKITPIIFIEEPESYLHPSAQAEFGATLRELAQEFEVQVIVTTHSPYLLSLTEPGANILLERRLSGKKLRQTEITDTSGDQWMEPFSLALGIGSNELAPWKEALFSDTECAIFVEGATDCAYLEALRDEAHGNNKLHFEGRIFHYCGKDALRQSQLIDIIRSRFKKCVITYDIDAASDVEPCLTRINLVKGKDFFGVGDPKGRRNIEGLLPPDVIHAVYAEHPDLVEKLETGSKTEISSAKSKLKALYLEKFKATVQPGSAGWNELYALAKKLNKMLAITRK